MSQSQNSEKSTKTDIPTDETLDTCFCETWEHNTDISENEAKSEEIPKKGRSIGNTFSDYDQKGF